MCCIPDDSGAECEDRSADACAAQGGTVIDATDCSANPCAATPPSSGNDDPAGDDNGGNGTEPGDDNGGHGGHGLDG